MFTTMIEQIFGYLAGASTAANTALTDVLATVELPFDASMALLIAAAVAAVIGLIIGLCGYRIFNFLLRVAFLVVGTVAIGPLVYAMIPVEALQSFVYGGYILGLVIGIILCIFAKKLFNLALFCVITLGAYVFLTPVFAALPLPEVTLPVAIELPVVLSVVCGIIASFIFVYFLLPAILIIGTSASGAATIVVAAILAFETAIKGAFGGSYELIMLIITAVLTVLFIIVQTSAAIKRKKALEEEEYED